jgi:hypothetical protein
LHVARIAAERRFNVLRTIGMISKHLVEARTPRASSDRARHELTLGATMPGYVIGHTGDGWKISESDPQFLQHTVTRWHKAFAARFVAGKLTTVDEQRLAAGSSKHDGQSGSHGTRANDDDVGVHPH